MTFNATYAGKVYSLVNGEVYTLWSDGNFRYAGAYTGSTVKVVLTGYTATSARGTVGYQTTGGGYIILTDGWQQVGTSAVHQYSQTQAQKLVNTIIANNKKIISNNLLCARFANKLSIQEREQVVALQNRLQVRNEALQAGGLTSNVRTSYPAGYAELSAYLDALMSGEAIGIATWVVVVIAATVIAATATAAYFAYKSLAAESEKDVKFSDDLTRTLTSKLTDEEYQQLLQETKGIVTKAKVKQALGSYWNVLQIAAFAVAGYAGYRFIKNYMQR